MFRAEWAPRALSERIESPEDAGSPAILARLREIVGRGHVLTGERQTRRNATGYRFGGGPVLAVVRPGSLVEMWRVLKLCAGADIAMIFQAANTGLTGGSTPDGTDYDRRVVILNTMRIKGVQPIGGGAQVICLPGATLDELERELRPLGREPHSVIGSSCLGASVFGGVCNNSGGSLVKRGPAYTQLSLHASIDGSGTIRLVNQLGVELGDTPEEALRRLESGEIGEADIVDDPALWGSDRDYERHVRQVDADTPARFNADTRRLYQCSGCAGKLAVFAVRLDTFPADGETRTFYIGTDDAAVLTDLRRAILQSFANLPVAGEYIHRTAFKIAETYGKDTVLLIRAIGTGRLPFFFGLKSRIDEMARSLPFLPRHLSDRLLQWASRLFPAHLPERIKAFGQRYEHQLILKVADDGIAEARDFLTKFFAERAGEVFECTPHEAKLAFLHRFAVAGAAIRYRAVHSGEVEDIVALDVALRRNDRDWQESLPPGIEARILHKLYYGHFFCHVFHQDYIVRKGEDCLALEHEMWSLLDNRGARYPAEHNVGHLYPASPDMAAFYKSLDETNLLNPGIGQTSKKRAWS